MTAYVLVASTVFDTSFLAGYVENVPPILQKHGGTLVSFSHAVVRREGEGPAPDIVVLLSFPSTEAIDAFLSDRDYQPYRAARLSSSSGDMFVFTG